MHHPTIWKFIVGLQKEQQHRNCLMEEFLAGHPAPPVRHVFRERQIRLQNVMNSFENREYVDYLRGIAHNIQL